MTMTELIAAATVVLTATSAALHVNSAAASALATAEQRLQALDRLDAELGLVERQLRDLAAAVPVAATATTPAATCEAKADALREQLAAQPASAGLVRGVERQTGPGSLLAVELRSEAANLTRQRIFSLAALGLCEAGHAPL